MSRAVLSRTLASLLIVESLCGLVSAQANKIEWKRSYKWSASDKKEVVALAKLMGVDDPAIVEANYRDDCCRIAWVTGRVVETGPERRWKEARMIRDTWTETEIWPNEKPLRVGHWIADGSPTTTAEWRVRDGGWFVDIGDSNLGVPPGTPYRETELIVLALRDGKFVNKAPEALPEMKRFHSIPALKAGGHYMLSNEPALGKTHQYEFSIDDKVLGIRINGDIVEVVAVFQLEF